MSKEITKLNKLYKYSKDEKELFLERTKRFDVMYEFKKKLGIDAKCDRIDELYTPHLTGKGNILSNLYYDDDNDDNDTVLSGDVVEESRKSKPLAFTKIQIAISTLIGQNPKVVLKAFKDKFRRLNLFIEHVYYDNWDTSKKMRVLRKYVYHLSKYGIGYWREYIKKTYRKKHIEIIDGNGEKGIKTIWVYDVFDQVAENIHPKNVVLDDGCLAVKDVNRPANDLFYHFYYTEDEFRVIYPEEKFPKSSAVKEGQDWMVNYQGKDKEINETNGKKKIQVIIYENRFDNLKETWANGVPIESVPLPGDELSLNGDKWTEDGDNYDGIGIGQLCEIYTPIVDDILNASLERLRQLVRPNEDFFNGAKISDESDDINYGSGNQRFIDGSPGDVQYNSPPPMTSGEQAEINKLDEEIDEVIIPKNLGGTDEAKTAYQSAANREAALKKLSIPLNSIKATIEDAANLSLALYPILYSEPEETKILKKGDEDFDEALSIVNNNPNDERVVKEQDKDGNPIIYRRYFKQLELPVAMEVEKVEDNGNVIQKPTGRVIYSDEKEFWEMIPKQFNWKGRISVIGESFLPVSKALEDEVLKESVDFILSIQTTDDMGRPVLTDQYGKPYTIDKVRAIKDRIRINKDLDPDKYVVPMDQNNVEQGDIDQGGNPLSNSKPLDAAQTATDGNGKRPELRGTKLF